MVGGGWEFTLKRGDKVVAFAKKQRMPVFGHMLVWQLISRKWLFEDSVGKPLANLKRYLCAVSPTVPMSASRIHKSLKIKAVEARGVEPLSETPSTRASTRLAWDLGFRTGWALTPRCAS